LMTLAPFQPLAFHQPHPRACSTGRRRCEVHRDRPLCHTSSGSSSTGASSPISAPPRLGRQDIQPPGAAAAPRKTRRIHAHLVAHVVRTPRVGRVSFPPPAPAMAASFRSSSPTEAPSRTKARAAPLPDTAPAPVHRPRPFRPSRPTPRAASLHASPPRPVHADASPGSPTLDLGHARSAALPARSGRKHARPPPSPITIRISAPGANPCDPPSDIPHRQAEMVQPLPVPAPEKSRSGPARVGSIS
jgi:hypothetical protein